VLKSAEQAIFFWCFCFIPLAIWLRNLHAWKRAVAAATAIAYKNLQSFTSQRPTGMINRNDD